MPTRVLLVDPDEDIVNAIAKLLARRGFEPLAATTERECVRHLRESAPHVLVIEPFVMIPEEGIGIRIEDGVLITEDGCEVLAGPPKEVEEVEALCKRE